MKRVTKVSPQSNLTPTLLKVDNNSGPFNLMRRFVYYLMRTAMNHKFKTVVILLGLYAAKKTYGLYNSFASTIKQLTG